MTADNAPLRTIVVEDEPLVRLMTEDVLTSIGCVIVASASTLNEAMICIPATELDLAVLDVNLGGTEVYPAAELLRSRGTPIIFVTGYGRRGVPNTWHQFPILQKPFTSRELEKAIAHVSGG
jgi:CheY-like chemotaxis protein